MFKSDTKNDCGDASGLEIGERDDKFEREADSIAGRVMMMPDRSPATDDSEEEEELRMKPERDAPLWMNRANADGRMPNMNPLPKKKITLQAESSKQPDKQYASSDVTKKIKQSKGMGTPLPKPVRQDLGQKMGADFSGVRIHRDGLSSRLNRSLGAKAFTHGRDIFFGQDAYNPASPSGRHLLAHELTHVVQQGSEKNRSIQRQPLTEAESNELCYEEGENPSPDASEPEAHPTYESWISAFHGLREFRSNDTIRGGTEGRRFRVLGDQAAERYGGEEEQDDEGEDTDEQTAPVPIRGNRRPGEQFIDHPTNHWVQNCLPSNLRATAYELPADCADIAVILRHVWLSAHNRTENFTTTVVDSDGTARTIELTVGDRSGDANQRRASRLIERVYSGNVQQMVNPYSDNRGNPIRTIEQLEPLLHPGDILVWEHREIISSDGRNRTRRTGGHTQTISHIERDNDGGIQSIEVLQGNLPIFESSATEISNALVPDQEQQQAEQQLNEQEQSELQEERAERQERNPRLTRMIERDREEAILTMRNAPGRRIEFSVGVGGDDDIADPTDPERSIWGSWDNNEQTEYTILIAAGPPRSASRPAPTDRSQGRDILDWNRRLSRSNRRRFTGRLEAMLQEARSLLERDQSLPENQVSESDLQTLATSAGNRLRRLYIRRSSIESLETEERINYLQRVASHLATIEYLGNNGNSELVLPRFNYFAQHFVDAAAPGSTVEELRSYLAGTYGPSQYINVFQNEIQTFRQALAQAPDFSTAQQVAESNGKILWQNAVQRANDPDANTDDRPLYWARLRMIQEIRYFSSDFNITDDQREDLVDIFERNSRGQETAQLSSYPHEKKIVISGFDPFGLHSNIEAYNPSGAAVLSLDGQTMRNEDISAQVEGVIFPVRFRDFNEGNIEQFFSGYLTGDPIPDMIMTISRGGSENFEVERYAGRRRSSEYQDNEAVLGGGTSDQPVTPPRLGPGDEFLETSLPHETMSNVEGVEYDESRIPASDHGTAVEGSGGGYLSNEIFYRVRRLSLDADQSIRVGHLHTPFGGMTRDEIINKVREIITVSLPHI